MTPRRQAAVALVCLAVLSGGGVAAEEPGASHSDHAAEAHHRHLVSAFVGATHDLGEDAFTFGAECMFEVVPERFGVGYDFEFGLWVVAPEVNVDFVHREDAVVYGVAIGRKF